MGPGERQCEASRERSRQREPHGFARDAPAPDARGKVRPCVTRGRVGGQRPQRRGQRRIVVLRGVVHGVVVEPIVHALVRDGAPLDGQQLAQAVSLQDRIGLVDLQLSAAHNGATTADLWQQRITLLQQLGLLHLQPYLAASQGSASNDHVISM